MQEAKNTIKARPVSAELVVLGALIVIYSLQGFIDFDYSLYAQRLYYLPKGLIAVRYAFSIGVRALLFISGVGIFFRREIFRKSAVFVCLFTIFTIYWKHPVRVFKDILVLKIKQGAIAGEMMPRVDALAWKSVFICYAIDITIALVLVYLLSRPRIKKCFF